MFLKVEDCNKWFPAFDICYTTTASSRRCMSSWGGHITRQACFVCYTSLRGVDLADRGELTP